MMLDDAHYQKNVERWALFHPEVTSELSKPCQRVFLHTNADGSINLKTTRNGQTLYYHSLKRPEIEATEWFAQLDLNDIEAIFVFGVGLGYSYDATKHWLRESPNRYLIFVEHDLEVFQHLLRTERGTEILADRQVWLSYCDEKGSIMDSLATYFLLKHDLCTALPLYEQIYPSEFQKMKSRLAFHLSHKMGMASEYRHSGRIFFTNFFRNLFFLPTAHNTKALYGKFSGVPAIICGAGPSLAKNLRVLQTLRDRALIFAGGTAMNALNTVGLLPHFGIGIDPNTAQFTRLIMNIAYQTPFFFRNRMNHQALSLVQGDLLFSTGSGGHETSRWFEERLGIAGEDLSEGYNVIGFSLAIAEALGCYPIILVGLDLAYSDNQPYCPGITNHPLHERREFFRTKTVEDELISHTNIYGEPVSTLWKWIAEAAWFSKFTKLHPKMLITNATEGGLGFEGIPNEPLQQVADTLLKKQFDFGAMVHGEIQDASMPKEANAETIRGLMEQLKESLKRCSILCKAIADDLQVRMDEFETSNQPGPYLLGNAGQQALKSLEAEDGYRHLLKDFLQMQIQIQTREIVRLNTDKGLLSDLEITLRRGILTKSRYTALGIVADDNIQTIEAALIEQTKIEAIEHLPSPVTAPTTRPPPSEQAPPDTTVEETYYPNGHVKLRQYRKDEKLHGSSTFFSVEGKILASNTFINGLQQGPGYFYYPDGTLTSEQHFLNGLWEGKQQYFYPNGTIKSILYYSKGVLDGSVQLFYPNGHPKRFLSFVHGKRQGIDRIWNRLGILTVEAEFNNDNPIGTARQWYATGILAKEIIFEKDSTNFKVRQWTPGGLPQESEWNDESDYFDEVAKGTGKLTASLELLLHQVFTPATGLPVEIAKLNQELEHLKELQKALMSQSGLDPGNQEEILWKSRSHQREAQKQITRMTSHLQEQMRVLAHTLQVTLEKFQKQQQNPPDKK